jgi:hypothetical protein
MSTNLVSLVMKFLTPDVIAKIAAAFGVDKSAIGKAVTAAVPSLLGGLAATASTPEGSRKLLDAVTQQPNILDGLASLIAGPSQVSQAEKGTNALSSLLGGSVVSGLSNAIGKFAGLGGGSSSSLLGMLTPVVLGALGKAQASEGLDASGLSRLLTSQKSSIAAAMPAGFLDRLQGSGLLSNLSGSVADVAQTAKSATQYAAYGADKVAKQASSSMSWVPWAAAAAIAVALGWWFFGHNTTNVADQAKRTVASAVQATDNLTVGTIDLRPTIQTTVDELRRSLLGITDGASATAALPKLNEAVTQLDKVGGVVSQLPAGGKTAFAALVAAARPSLDELFGKVLAIPGVAEIAKPTIDTLRGKLDTLAKTVG